MINVMPFLKFFADLWKKSTPALKINILLFLIIGGLVFHISDLKQERNDYKDRYTTEQTKHNIYVKMIQDARDKQTNDCNEVLRGYMDKKNKEVETITNDFRKRYLDMLTKYQLILEKKYNDNEKNN